MRMKLPNLTPYGVGNTLTLKVPVGAKAPTIDQIVFTLGGTLTSAHIDWVKVLINGRITYDEGTGGAAIRSKDLYHGTPLTADQLVLDFTQPDMRSSAEQLITSLACSLFSDLTVQVKISAAAPVGGTIVAAMEYRPPTSNPNVLKRFSKGENVTAAATAGVPYVLYVPSGRSGGKILRTWLFEGSAGAITSLEMRSAGTTLWEGTRVELEDMAVRNGKVIQAGIVCLDWTLQGNLAGMLPTDLMPDIQLRLVTSSAVSLNVQHEFVDPFNNL